MTTNYDPVSYRVVFASSAPIGIPFMQGISDDPRFDIVGVVTQPDQPSGRGLKMKSNIIKSEWEKIITNNKNTYNFILIHGQGGSPEGNFLPWLEQELMSQGHKVTTPILPHPDDFDIEEKVAFLKKEYSFDENTIILWHSFGSLIWMKLIEQLKQPIAGMVSISGMYDRRVNNERRARNDADAFKSYDIHKSQYGKIELNYWLLITNCTNFVIVWDKSDPAVPPQHQVILSNELYAPLIQWVPLAPHITGDQEPLVLQWIEQLLNIINKADFIQTPNTLRLKSSKYPWEWAAFQSWLESKQVDFLVVIAYGNIIPQHILNIPRIAPINVHGSLLPQYRGASPIQSVLLDDKAETGITIMRMEAGLDTGPMLRAQWFPLTIHTTSRDIIRQFESFGPQLLIDTMVDYAHWSISELPQDTSIATHCGKLDKSDWLVDPRSQSLSVINNIYRACILRPKTYFVLNDIRGKYAGKTIIIEEMLLDDELWEDNKQLPLFIPDVILSEAKNPLKSFSINSTITFLIIKPEWGKAMSWEDWLRGV